MTTATPTRGPRADRVGVLGLALSTGREQLLLDQERAQLCRTLGVASTKAIPGVHRPMWRPRQVHTVVAAEVCRRAVHRDDWLPRWQRRSVIHHDQAAVEAAYRARGCVQWASRVHWLTVVVTWAIEHHPDLLRPLSANGKTHYIAEKTFRHVLNVFSLYAKRQNGRNVIVRPSTLAQLAGCAERTVQYVLAAAHRVGLLVRLTEGRMLTWDERCEAIAGGSRQRGLSTVWACVLPPEFVRFLRSCTPPQEARSFRPSSVSETPNNRSAGTQRPASPPHQRSSGRRSVRNSRQKARGFALAVELRDRLEFLDGLSPGFLAPSVARYATPIIRRGDATPTVAFRPWTAKQLVDALRSVNRRLGYHVLPREAKAPLALLKWYLDQIDPWADHPDTLAALDRQAKAADLAERRRLAQLEREQRAAEAAAAVQPDQVSARVAAVRAQIRRGQA